MLQAPRRSLGFIIILWSAAPPPPSFSSPTSPLHTSDPAQWLGAMPIRNKSHEVNKPLFLGKGWDRVQMHVISPRLPRRMGAGPAPVPPTGTSCGLAGKHWGQAGKRREPLCAGDTCVCVCVCVSTHRVFSQPGVRAQLARCAHREGVCVQNANTTPDGTKSTGWGSLVQA